MFLDSTFLIDILRGKPQAISFLQEKQSTPLFTSEVNVFELVEGAYASEEKIQVRLEKVFGLLSRMTVLPLDRKAALKAGELCSRLSREGKTIGEIDCLIAGIALSNGISTILTENKSHFDRIKEIKVISY